MTPEDQAVADPAVEVALLPQATIVDKKQLPGFVEFQRVSGEARLDDLWFMVGSRCNLTCTHCYVDSSPTNDSLEQMTFDDVQPFLSEAVGYGLRHVYFTGGEPFINRDIIVMIEAALGRADCTVLTNATTPIVRHVAAMRAIAEANTYRLTLRVSLDHYDEPAHDAIRGTGNFQRTVRNIRLLCDAGLNVIVTATTIVYEGSTDAPETVESRFAALFPDVPVDVKILPFTLEMGANLRRVEAPSEAVFISEDCMERPGVRQENFQCHSGRTVQKIRGRMTVYPCPIIYDDPRFELGDNLTESFGRVHIQHKACYDFCYGSGGSCTD